MRGSGLAPCQVNPEIVTMPATATEVSFSVSRADATIITAIVARGYPMLKDAWNADDARMKRLGADALSLRMDITACHANGCPLRLADFLAADDFNFAHDFAGIHRHINRQTGQLENCFLPRFHRHEG